MTHLYLITQGEFEISQSVEFVTKNNNRLFDLKEFLPQTEHKYANNLKT